MQAFYVTLSLYFLFKLIHQYCRSQNIQSNIITDARGRATSSAIYKQEYLTFQRKLISSVFINQWKPKRISQYPAIISSKQPIRSRKRTSVSIATDSDRNTCRKYKTGESQRTEKNRKNENTAFLHNKYLTLFYKLNGLLQRATGGIFIKYCLANAGNQEILTLKDAVIFFPT